jgi:hypothetical protein
MRSDADTQQPVGCAPTLGAVCAAPPGSQRGAGVEFSDSVPAMARLLPAVLMLVLACSQPVLASRAANNITKPVGRKTQAHPQGMYALGSVIDIDGCVPHHHSMPLTTCTPTWLGLPGGFGGPPGWNVLSRSLLSHTPPSERAPSHRT